MAELVPELDYETAVIHPDLRFIAFSGVFDAAIRMVSEGVNVDRQLAEIQGADTQPNDYFTWKAADNYARDPLALPGATVRHGRYYEKDGLVGLASGDISVTFLGRLPYSRSRFFPAKLGPVDPEAGKAVLSFKGPRHKEVWGYIYEQGKLLSRQPALRAEVPKSAHVGPDAAQAILRNHLAEMLINGEDIALPSRFRDLGSFCWSAMIGHYGFKV